MVNLFLLITLTQLEIVLYVACGIVAVLLALLVYLWLRITKIRVYKKIAAEQAAAEQAALAKEYAEKEVNTWKAQR